MPTPQTQIDHLLWQWTGAAELGFEQLQLTLQAERVEADSVVLGVEQTIPFRLHYQVQCDGQFHFQQGTFTISLPAPKTLQLVRAADGQWRDGAGTPLPHLNGCVDIDIMASPFTNTLPIRRLAFLPGQTIEINVAYIAVPTLAVTAERQRYTCLAQTDIGSRYRFESLVTGFVTAIEVDAQGFVVDYPGLFRRVWFA